MYNSYEISTTIKQLAQSKTITIKKLLDDCQINKGFIYDLEHKKTYPSCDKVARIADYLDVSVDYLLGRTNQPDRVFFDDSGQPVVKTPNDPPTSTS